MYDPKFRMALLISIAVTLFTVINVILEYVIGDANFRLDEYLVKVTSVGGAITGGFIFVLVCTKFITFEKFRKTGFEPTFRDETGTGFNFPVSLSKYLPDIIAPPHEGKLHEVEADLLGFLNAYRTWPYDITGQDQDSLYKHAHKQWVAMRRLPDTTPYHYIAALAQDLGKAYAYTEKRKHFPLLEFWKQDKVVYTRRCVEHGGLSAFILGTLESFMRLPERTRRAILIAVRYRDNPVYIPANCDPLAMDIYEALHMAAEQVRKAEGVEAQGEAKQEDVDALEKETRAFFNSIIREMEVNPAGLSSKSDGVYLGDGILVLKMSKAAQAFAGTLTPELRRRFNMWQLAGKPHPCWPAFISVFKRMEILLEEFQNARTNNGLFDLQVDNQHLANAVVLKIDLINHTELRNSLDALPKFSGIVQVVQDEEALREEILTSAKKMDALLQEAKEAI